MIDRRRPPPVPEEEALGRAPLPADRTEPYGPSAVQTGDLRLPAGDGPHPVAVLLHGGCWRAIADRRYMDGLAVEMTRRGWATWNMDYRTLGHPGGGYPGTFQDVAAGVDHVRRLAADHPLDPERVVTLGHSAGGHLALWAAARPRIPPASDVGSARPLDVRGVVSLAGIADLAAFDALPDRGCGDAVRALLGAAPAAVPHRCAAASPDRLLPLGVPQLLVAGALDPVVPPAHAREYVLKARAAGDRVELLEVPQAGHFELVAPWWTGWDPLGARILAFLAEAA